MSPLQRFLERYLGLDAAGPGEGTAWGIDAGPSAGAPISLGMLAVVALLAIGLIVAVYLRDAARLSWRTRIALMSLRIGAVLVLLAMLARVSLRVDRTDLPTVAVLIDVSGSMSLQDQYADRRLAAAAKSLAPTTARQPTRLEIAQALLTRGDGRWLDALRRTHQVRLFTFDEHLRPLEARDVEDGDPSGAIRGLEPTGLQTAPGRAVVELLDEYRGGALSGVVLFTDGITVTSDADRLSAAAEVARERGTPLYPVGIGSDDPTRDVELYDLLADEIVYVGDPVTLTFRRRSYGFVGKDAEVRVTAAGRDEPLATKTVRLGADGASVTEEITFTPAEEGPLDLVIEAQPLPGESDAENNVLRHRMSVRRDQFRVLLVEGPPRWEYRSLKPVLERDDTLQLETYLQEADLNYAPEDRTALSNFPATDEQLQRYDVVIWGDVDLSALAPDVPERLTRYVGEHGGGLLLIAGESHNPLGYAGTELEALLPVALDDATLPSEEEVLGLLRFRLERTEEAAAWPFMRLDDDPAKDKETWESLPAEIDWFVVTPHRKPGAQVLAVHPTHQTAAGRTPVIVHQRYGRGQVLYHATDELWTWRKRVEDLYYGRYWSQAVRSLARTRASEERGLELIADRRVYQPGEEVRLRLRGAAGADSLEGASSVEIVVESSGGYRSTAALHSDPADPDARVGTVRGLPVGEYRASLSPSEAGTQVATSFRIEAPALELRQRAIDRADLERAAKTSHGRFITFADADNLPRDIPQGRAVRRTKSEPIPLWNRWELLLLATTLLGAEWVLRKRSRLV